MQYPKENTFHTSSIHRERVDDIASAGVEKFNRKDLETGNQEGKQQNAQPLKLITFRISTRDVSSDPFSSVKCTQTGHA